MKKLLTAAVAVAVLAGGATAANAQSYGYYGYSGHDHRYDDRRDYRDYRKALKAERKAERKAARRWARGQHLPPQYRSSRYVVNDYHRYGLRAPPRGYHYVRDDNSGDILMTAIATGLITAVIAGMLN